MNPQATSRSKLVFTDFDGTYADDGNVPEEHVRAVAAAQRNGHQVFLCTGRPLSGLGSRALQARFDGLVCAAGGYVRIDGKVLADRRYSPELAQRSIDVLDRHEGVYIFEHPKYVYCTASGEARLRQRFKTHVDMLNNLRPVASLAGIQPSKITVLGSRLPIRDIAAEIGPAVKAMPGSVEDLGTVSGELQLADVEKLDGIKTVVDYLGAHMEDVIACGDGLNDLEMVAGAGVGVGIEGGYPKLLEVADIVVPGPKKHGLVQAFHQLGLL